MTRFSILALALMLGGCANGVLSQDPDPDQPQQIATADAVLRACLVRAVHRVDDGRSDAAGVGLTALNACSNERSMATSAHLKGLDRLSREMQSMGVTNAQTQMATSVVLDVRVGKN